MKSPGPVGAERNFDHHAGLTGIMQYTYGYSRSRDAGRSGNSLVLKRGGGSKNTCAPPRRSNLSQIILRELSHDGPKTRKIAVKAEHSSHKSHTTGDLHQRFSLEGLAAVVGKKWSSHLLFGNHNHKPTFDF